MPVFDDPFNDPVQQAARVARRLANHARERGDLERAHRFDRIAASAAHRYGDRQQGEYLPGSPTAHSGT
jgi:hypothetical protein